MDLDHRIYKALLPFAEPNRIPDFSRYFQNYEGGYGEGDVFIGVMVPLRREVAKEHAFIWTEEELATGLIHPCHEVRHTALFAVMRLFGADKKRRGYWHDFLRTHFEGMNNWDLVDTCAYKIFGRWAYEQDDYSTVEEMLGSSNVWERRTAVVSTLHGITKGRFDEAFAYCVVAAEGAPEILQKGIGWVLKTVWQKNSMLLEAHLSDHYRSGLYSRLIVRIALEKAEKEFRNDFLARG
jgi:3-methyladenine DNA glycosylase AlkD